MYANCTGTAFPNWRIFPFQTIRKVWADWSSAAGWPAAERREAHSSHLWTEGESVPTSEALSRMSMGSAALLSGTDSLRLGEGFSAVPVIRSLTESAQP